MKKKTVILSLLSTLSLCSCFYLEPRYPDDTSSTGSNTNSHYKTPTYTSDYKTSNLNKRNIGLGLGYRYLPSVGNSKILVVPVETSDDSFTDDELSLIEDAFFGDASNTGWESVSSFYEKSSYSKLHISGDVVPTIKLNMTTAKLEQMSSSYDSNGLTYTDVVLESVLKTIANNTSINLSQYDTDSDGYIDAVWMVYSPSYSSSSDLYWAYTTWLSDSTISFNGKKACCYAWASVDFLKQGGYVGGSILNRKYLADSHTFIHETGHMLGLDDYYSYDYEYSSSKPNGNADTPMGGVDMMDFNIGDHTAYSKYFLGWVEPTIITKEYLEANGSSLTLRSLVDTGEFFIIPIYDNGTIAYNGTSYDEYLVVEYYTPTGLNEKDATERYSNGLLNYTKEGVLVYHVNATVGKLLPDTSGNAYWNGEAYDKLPSYSSQWGYYYAYAPLYSNTASYCWDESLTDTSTYYRGRLVSLLSASGKKISGAKTGYASDVALFTKGKTFGGSKGIYSEFKFDDGNKPFCSFKVDKISSDDCVLSFSY